MVPSLNDGSEGGNRTLRGVTMDAYPTFSFDHPPGNSLTPLANPISYPTLSAAKLNTQLLQYISPKQFSRCFSSIDVRCEMLLNSNFLLMVSRMASPDPGAFDMWNVKVYGKCIIKKRKNENRKGRNFKLTSLYHFLFYFFYLKFRFRNEYHQPVTRDIFFFFNPKNTRCYFPRC